MRRVLFLIHDLGCGGAEKVLVNLVNNMDPTQFEITLVALFGGGVNEQFLRGHIRYRAVFSGNIPGNSHIMKLLTPRQLHRLCVREPYDIEISYLEGPSARVVSGCRTKGTKLVCWIHSSPAGSAEAAAAFRSEREMRACYGRFDRIVSVSEAVRTAFARASGGLDSVVLYNTNESDQIRRLGRAGTSARPACRFCLAGVGKLVRVKGFDRLLRVQKRLVEDGLDVHLMLLGSGPEEQALRTQAAESGLAERVHFLGYQKNPYPYLSQCDLFVCSSHSEGFSTAATEALILGVPVCTTDVAGMREMLGQSEYGLITENSDNGLYDGLRRLMDDPALLAHYRQQAAERGRLFETEQTVRAVEQMLKSL